MENHLKLTDMEFEARFKACELSPGMFSHEAHIRLAWIHIRKYGIEKAVSNLRFQIQAYTACHGASDKYNETVTVAATRAVYHFMLKSADLDFKQFIEQNRRLKYNLRELLAQHYTTDIFNSDRARREYLEPELLPFD